MAQAAVRRDHQEGHPLLVPEVMERTDVRMIESGDRPRLDQEAIEPSRLTGPGVRDHLDGDITVEAGVAGAVHLAHSTAAQQGDDLIGAEGGPPGEPHGVIPRSGSLQRLATPLLPRPRCARLVGWLIPSWTSRA
jgi:hypothetical protein